MAIFFSRSSLILLVLYLAFFYGCSADLISDVCTNHTIDEALCNQVLRSAHNRDPDLVTLAKIALSTAEDSTNKLEALARSMSQSATDPELKRRFDVCADGAKNAYGKLLACETSLHTKRYFKMPIEVDSAIGVLNCPNQFKTPPDEPALLKQVDVDTVCYMSIVESVSRLLSAQ